MKKRSLFIVVAMVLLLAVVLGMGGTTFAKYITQDSDDSNTATVAKWGYVVSIDAENLFSDAYKNDLAVANTETGLEVDATAFAVAPGTTGSFDVNVSGKAEVLSSITFDITKGTDVVLNKLDGAAFGTPLANDYYPVTWNVTGTTKVDTAASNTDNDAVDIDEDFANLDELLAWFDGNTLATVAPNTDVAIDWTITWTWAFNGNDEADTKLGDMAAAANAGTNGSCYVLDFDVAVVVQQLDKAA